MRRLIKRFQDWLDSLLDMHLDFTGDLMTPDWSVGDGDPVLRPERKPATLTAGMYYTPEPIIAAIESGAFPTRVAQHVERLKGREK